MLRFFGSVTCVSYLNIAWPYFKHQHAVQIRMIHLNRWETCNSASEIQYGVVYLFFPFFFKIANKNEAY